MESTWVEGFAVVTFDIDVGQRVEVTYPPSLLSNRDFEKKVAYLSLPDSHSGQIGDSVYTFRLRKDDEPLQPSISARSEYLFGFVLFRQKKDDTLPRGFFQKSVVLLTHRPYVGLYKRVIRLVGPLYFDMGKTALEAAYTNIASWQVPRPGLALELPILGTLLPFRVPWLGLESYHSRRHHGPRAADMLYEDVTLDMPSLGRDHSIPSGTVAQSGTETKLQPYEEGNEANMGRSLQSRRRLGNLSTLSVMAEEGQGSEEVKYQYSPSSPLPWHDDGRQSSSSFHRIDSTSTLNSCPSPDHAPIRGKRRDSVSGTSDSDGWGYVSAGRLARIGAGYTTALLTETGTIEGGGMSLSLAEVFATKEQELPGVFQSIGLFSTFRGLVPKLWHLWEMALCGEPIMVIGPTSELCGDAVMGIVSLVSPLPFASDYRPYFTLYDPDFKVISAAHEAYKKSKNRSSLPSIIMGTTSPFFVKNFESWPNVVFLAASPDTKVVPIYRQRRSVSLSPQLRTSATNHSVEGPQTQTPSFSARDTAASEVPDLSLGSPHPRAAEDEESSARKPSSDDQVPQLKPSLASPQRSLPGTISRSSNPTEGVKILNLSTTPPSQEEIVQPSVSAAVTPKDARRRVARRTKSYRLRKMFEEGAMLSSFDPAPRIRSSEKAIDKIVSEKASLANILPMAGHQSVSNVSMLVTRCPPCVEPDRHVIKQLLAIDPEAESDPSQLKVADIDDPNAPLMSFGGNASSVAFLDAHIPGVAINNAVLRQHFRSLTLAFLKPFETYFQIKKNPNIPSLAFGPYDDLVSYLLPKFDEKAFLAQLEATGPPSVLRGCNWRSLYRRFLRSPHFRPWRRAREEAARKRLYLFSRTLRLSLSDAELAMHLRGNVPHFNTQSPPSNGDSGQVASSVEDGDESSPLNLRRITSDDFSLYERRCLELREKIEIVQRKEARRIRKDPLLQRTIDSHLAVIRQCLAEIQEVRNKSPSDAND